MRFINWFWRDRRTGRIVVAQWPNVWLWAFIVFSVAEIATDAAGPLGLGVRFAATASLVIWAGDELFRGVNPWRRCLGAAVLTGLTVRLVTGS